MLHMAAQDDAREQQMLLMFNLTVPPDRTRGGLDAVLELDGQPEPIPFELKSTTSKSVSTVRDMSPAHITKWRGLHWLFAFYETDSVTLRHCYYASPADMAEWFEQQERYIRPDLIIADRAPRLLSHDDLIEVVGERDFYTVEDAKAVMKKQWTAAQYVDRSNRSDGTFSPELMLELLQERCAYVLRRGSTLNNPHIPASYLTGRLEPIVKNHAATLRTLVAKYLKERAEQVAAGVVPTEDAVDPVVAQASAAATDDATV